MYTSKLGYASVIRQTDGAFPVKVCEVRQREIIGKFIGEGLTQSEPIQVPMIAMGRILKVNASEGARVRAGEVLVEIDTEKIDLKIASARASLSTAKAELERVELGTVNVLQDERPDVLALRAAAAEEEAVVALSALQVKLALENRDSASGMEISAAKLAAIQAELNAKEKRLLAETAITGRENSIRIANASIQEAELHLQHRLADRRDYESICPSDGIVERVLVHEGEYNQDPGRPAMLLACGLWFECYLDQTALGRVFRGDEVEIRLSAYQDRIFRGKVIQVKPLVNFALGGPETNRPIRPLGTGAPEWPSTFSVRIEIETEGELVVPGMTGYGTIVQKRFVPSVPVGTVTAISGGRGIAYVLTDEEHFEPREVVVGLSDGDWVEIKEGVVLGDRIICDGYQVLKPDDRITAMPFEAESSESEGSKNTESTYQSAPKFVATGTESLPSFDALQLKAAFDVFGENSESPTSQHPTIQTLIQWLDKESQHALQFH